MTVTTQCQGRPLGPSAREKHKFDNSWKRAYRNLMAWKHFAHTPPKDVSVHQSDMRGAGKRKRETQETVAPELLLTPRTRTKRITT
eukprot:1468625-Amphidinium_carterae.1